jgi:hypothetical protein
MKFRYFKCKDAPNLMQKRNNNFFYKETLKERANFLKTKATQTKFLFSHELFRKKKCSFTKQFFVTKRHSKKETKSFKRKQRKNQAKNG